MTDTFSPEAIIEQAREGLSIIDRQIASMREERKILGNHIAQALEDRKPLARIVAAATPRSRKARSNGE